MELEQLSIMSLEKKNQFCDVRLSYKRDVTKRFLFIQL